MLNLLNKLFNNCLPREIPWLYIKGENFVFHYSLDIYKDRVDINHKNRGLTFIETLNEVVLYLDQYSTSPTIIQDFLNFKNTKLSKATEVQIRYSDFSKWKVEFTYNNTDIKIKEDNLKQIIKKINSIGDL